MTRAARDHSDRVPVRIAEGVFRLTLPSDTLPPYEDTHLWLITAADQAALVDPGFRTPGHVEQVARALQVVGARDLKMVLLSHTHRDHLAGLAAVRERFGDVPVYVHPAERERVPGRGRLLSLQDDRRLMLAGRVIHALHTPGHAPGHLAFHLADVAGVLSGDLLTAEGSTWVGVPEGDADAYLASLERISALRPAWLGPAHGPELGDAASAVARARESRRARSAQIEQALHEPLALDELRRRVYPEATGRMVPVVEASLLAHLAALMARTRVMHLGEGPDGPYRRRP